MTKKTAPAAAPEKIVRAIDVGFGLVKLSRAGTDGGIEFMAFPSIAVAAEPSAMREVASRRRDTFDVPTGNGGMYEVGVEVTLAQTGNDFGREITDEYFRTAIYEALMKGALRYIDEDVIDVLVLGLPVSQYQNDDRRDLLAKQWTTGHSRSIDIGGGKSVKILEVVVRPQPLGGYVEMFNRIDQINTAIKETGASLAPINSANDMVELTTLVVDPGEHTLDWLLVQRGQINTKASGAVSDAGRHKVVRAVFEALQAKLGRPLGAAIQPRLNDALRSSSMSIKLSGEMHDLRAYEGVIQTAVEDPINRLIEGLRGMIEFVELIVMVGGHPERYADELKKRFPAIPVVYVENPVFANVCGFQAVGEELAARRAEELQAA